MIECLQEIQEIDKKGLAYHNKYVLGAISSC